MRRAEWFRAGSGALVVASVLALASASSAADGWVTLPYTPFQLAIAPGAAQVFSKETPVHGLRISVLYGIQSEVVGLDVGLFNQTDSMTGIGVGLCNMTQGNGAGIQLGAGCSDVEGDFVGIQAGLFNQVRGQISGFQVGLANGAESGTGLMIGLVNRTDSMRGLQIGVLNWNKNGFLPLFPIFNFGY